MVGMKQGDTKKKILDAAECLFARQGYHATSLRQITGRARVNLASVNYHFGTKKELVKAVIERRLHPLNELREERLRQVEELLDRGGRQVRCRDIMRAFIEPTVHFRSSVAGGSDFITLVGRILVEPDQTARGIFLDLIRPLFTRLSLLLARVLPHLPADVLFCRLVFVLSAMGQGVNALEKCAALAPGLAVPEEPEAIVENLLSFAVGGIEAPL